MKKILFVLKLPPPVNGATNCNLNIINSSIIKKKYHCSFINYGLARNNSDFGKHSPSKYYKYLKSIILLLFYFIFKTQHLIYITIAPRGIGFFKDSLFILISKIFRKKIVIHLHGKGILNALNNKFITHYYQFIFKNTVVICLTQGLKKDVIPIYFDEPYVLNYGIVLTDCKVHRKTSTINILYLANLYKSKGVLDFVEGIELLVKSVNNFKAHIVGNSTSELTISELKEYIQTKNLDEKIIVYGPKYGNDKTNIFSEADIFCFPTYYSNEAMPLVVLEAMQSGLPIITTNEGGLPDIIKDGINGFIINSRSREEIVEKLLILINNEELRKKISENNRKEFLEKYTLEIFEKNLDNILCKVV